MVNGIGTRVTLLVKEKRVIVTQAGGLDAEALSYGIPVRHFYKLAIH